MASTKKYMQIKYDPQTSWEKVAWVKNTNTGQSNRRENSANKLGGANIDISTIISISIICIKLSNAPGKKSN